MNKDHCRRWVLAVIVLGIVISIALIIVFLVRRKKTALNYRCYALHLGSTSDERSATSMYEEWQDHGEVSFSNFSDATIDLNRTGVTTSMDECQLSHWAWGIACLAAPMMDVCVAQSCVLTDVRAEDHLFTFWSFDRNVLDRQNNSNAIAVNEPFYYPEYAGVGRCILFNGIDQYAVAPYIPLNNRSFTIDMFILLNLFPNDTMFTILSQCAIGSGTYQCLTLAVKNAKLFFGYSNDYQVGTTTLEDNRWYEFVLKLCHSTCSIQGIILALCSMQRRSDARSILMVD